MRACSAGTQTQLAGALGISQAAVTQAIAKGKIPEGWAYKVAYSTGRRVDWILSGRGTEFANTAAEEMERYRRELPPALHDLTEQWTALTETERAIVDNALKLLLSSDAETRGLMVNVLQSVAAHRKAQR